MSKVKLDEVRRFIVDCLKAAGAPEQAAKEHADLLMYADTVGHTSHGLNRLLYYVNDCKSGACTPAGKPKILRETEATAWVDGSNALGATIGTFCMNLAMAKAKQCGVAWVAAKQCNHFGMGSYWTEMAVRQGLIGFSLTNTSPLMVPTRSKKKALGSNPISMAAPADKGDRMVVDLATTAVALGKIEMQVHKDEPLPPGWALGPDGLPTTDAKRAFKAAHLMPLGGGELTSGHKGYALAAMIEILCSGLSGSKLGHTVRSWASDDKSPRNLGQCFAAINPDCFGPDFTKRISETLSAWRNLDPVDPSRPVLAPGDMEQNIGKNTKARGTINYPPKQIKAVKALAVRLGVKPLRVEP